MEEKKVWEIFQSLQTKKLLVRNGYMPKSWMDNTEQDVLQKVLVRLQEKYFQENHAPVH
jgi:hypothetical protein